MNQDNSQDRPVPASDDAVSAGQTPQTPQTPQAPEAGTTPPSAPAADAPATGVPAAPHGHHMPPTFASHAAGGPTVAPVPHGLAAPGPAAAGVPGAAFGVPAQDTRRLDGTVPPSDGTPTATKEKSRGGTRVAAFIVAAALVGGVAGFGGGALLTGLQDTPSSGTAQGPQTVTVNNPGSVNETTAVATEALPSVVTIEVAGSQEAGSGSGVIISKDGYVLTNTHVVTLGGAVADPTIRVTTSDGRIYQATIVGTDPIYDLAVIKLTDAKDLTPIKFADSSKLNVGDTAVALGAPLGLANSVTTGIVSALNRSIQIASSALPDSSSEDAPQEQAPEQGQGEGPFQFDLPGNSGQQATESISIAVIQTDAAINHGNSGGALVNSKGELIGINVAIAGSGNSEDSGSIGIGFAIPSNIAERVSEEIIADGQATHGLLGASVRDAAGVEGATEAGAYIAEVTDGGAAAAAGLKAGDVVTSFNGVPISNATDLTAQVRAAAAGSKADVTYVRNGSQDEVEVTLGTLAG
ncbi:S1C family serine protease [Microbacterium sp. BLY]|uniref:S1C family serine protease n=1 Tax=Microbacterium sp. BLY TaxID=2823280 RepID=UPI001FF08F61|nr:trypsin-like peptidase domain-containing protein [Microbacterium sp. BLY]